MIKCRLLGHKYRIVKTKLCKINDGGTKYDGRDVFRVCERCGKEDAYVENDRGKIEWHEAPWAAKKFMGIKDEETETVTGQPRVEGTL